jgi:hypothetical protein
MTQEVHPMRSPAIAFALLAVLPLAAPAAAATPAPKFAIRAAVDAREISIDEELDLLLVVDGVFESFEDPALPDFEVVGRVGRERNVLVDGRPVAFREIAFRLRPRRVGTLTIAPARMSMGGKVVAESLPLTVTVTNAPPPVPASQARDLSRKLDRKLFLHAWTDQDAYYVGQPFVVSWDLYYDPDLFVVPLNVDRAPKLEGLEREEVLVADQAAEGRTVGGKRFMVRRYSRQLVTAAHPGTFVIDPLRLHVRVEDRWDKARVAAAAFEVRVKALPEGHPDYFRAPNVGQFNVETSLTSAAGPVPARLGADDELILDVTVTGSGNLANIEAPILGGEDRFYVERTFPRGTRVIRKTATGIEGHRTFRYLLRPREPGRYVTPTVYFGSFDPVASAYETVTVQGQPIEVDATMVPLLGGRTIGTAGRQGARAELGWPGLLLTYVIGIERDVDLSPQIHLLYGQNLRTGLLGLEGGLEIRWSFFADGPFAVALVSDPAVLIWVPTDGGPGQFGARFGVPAFIGSWQIASKISLSGGIRLPLQMTFEKDPVVLLPLLVELGVEVQIHRSEEAIVNLLGVGNVGPSLCLTGPCQTEASLRLALGASVAW